MRVPEEKRFLDLDMVAERIRHDGDRDMFLEALSCYQVGSHRAAVILAWSTAADCLRRRIQELAAESDATAKAAIAELKAVEGQAGFEEALITKSRQCELVDDYEEKCLRFARDTRSKCAHPSGVVPSAEAVRHILHVCSQMVLCRRGYRGTSYVRRVVTIEFDDAHAFPHAERVVQHCDEIIERVPQRLWPLFTRLAAEERPTAAAGTWRNNALVFFRRLLERAETDGLANDIAIGFQGFQEQAPEFFAILVGLDARVNRIWSRQQRDQARARLLATSAVRVTGDEVASWANICAVDGIEGSDAELLQRKLGALVRHLPDGFLVGRRDELLGLIAEMAEDDSHAAQAALGLQHLLATDLVEDGGDKLARVMEQLVKRFRRDDRYRQLLEDVKSWRDPPLYLLLDRSRDYLLECSEDDPDDVLMIFEAATEVARRGSPGSVEGFSEAIRAALAGEVRPEWSDRDSDVRRNLVRQTNLLIARFPGKFPVLQALRASLKEDDAEEEFGIGLEEAEAGGDEEVLRIPESGTGSSRGEEV